MKKEYTPIRQFYAWVGFAAIILLVVFLIILFILSLYPPSNTMAAVSPAKIEIAAVVTEYTSSADETDSTPFLNASGTRPKEGSIACPSKYPFGTVVTIGGQDYKCDDRMAREYRDQPHFDIWVQSKAEAFKFGNKLEIVTI